MRHIRSKLVSTTSYVLIIALLLLGVGLFSSQKTNAAGLGARYVKLGSAVAATSGVPYEVSFTITTPGTLGSVELQFCSNSSLPEDTCDAPNGFNASGAVLASQSGVTGFSISPASTANNVILTRTPSAVGAVQVTVRLNGIVNPSAEGSYYGKIFTHASTDASDPYTDFGGLAFAINPSVSINTEVPPYLIFCIGNAIPANDCSTAEGDYVNVGDMGPTYTSSGQTQLLAGTNAEHGYSISVQGPTLTSGNNEIPVITPGGISVPGVSQFGINLRANTSPVSGQNPTGPGTGTPTIGYSQANHYRYASGDTIASSSNADDYRRYTVSYVINVSANQPPGVYASTFTYVCLANF